MATVLVVANETLGGRKLVEAVKARAERGDATFVVIAPQNRPKAGYVVYDESVRDAAQHRVDTTIAQLREVGVEATGEVMDPDPYHAVVDAVGEFGADEIIISTHPATRSGWLRRDLVERVEESTGLPVEHVVVDLDAEREGHGVTRTLVVANKTVGGAPLLGLLRGKAAEKPHHFIVVVPQEGSDGEAVHEARDRLASVLERMQQDGLQATGGIGDPDPFTAIMNALQYYTVDEIVISTHPATRSGWLRADLIERVQRSTATPVEHVVVDLEAAQAG
jgi:hypothetical protein